MTSVKIVISEPQTKKTFQKEIDQSVAVGLIGKKIGDEVSGDVFGLAGYSLQITGGSDSDGFPMHPELKGPGRKRLLLGGTPGFHPWAKGMRKRKMVHGNTISDDIAQINSKVLKKGEKPLEELVPMKPKEKPAKEEKKEQPKPEEKQKEQKAEKPKTEEKKEVKAEPQKEAPKAEEKPKEAPKAEQKVGGEKVQ